MTDYLIALGIILYIIAFLAIAFTIIALFDDYDTFIPLIIIVVQFYFMLVVPTVFVSHHIHNGVWTWATK